MVGRRAALLIGALGALGVFAGLFLIVGGHRVLESLSVADSVGVGVTFALGLCWLLAWSLMLRTVLGTLDVRVPLGKSFFVYAGAVFANNVTPFGQAGGEPVAALLISKVSGSRYETGLVGIASVDALNVVSSLSLVIISVGYYATTSTVGDRLQTAVGTAVGLVVGTVVLAAFVWQYRDVLVRRIAGAVGSIAARLDVTRLDPVAAERNVEERLSRFFGHVEHLGTDRQRLVAVFGLSLSGWLFQAGALFAAFAAVGHDVPVTVVLFAIPLGNLAGATPLPGGLGGIEAAFVALLVPTTGIAAPAVTAAVLIYRGAIYWMPVVIGGGSVTAFGVRSVA